MGDVHYMISETAKRVGVESHVLRYWEEELSLPIGRTEMGHRHYTEDDIQLFACIKELKDQGMQLRELKNVIPDMLKAKEAFREKRRTYRQEDPASDTEKEDMEAVFYRAVQKAVKENNQILEELICRGVTEKVSKEVDFLLQARERQEEDRYRKLDHLIRQQQTLRRESARSIPERCIRKLFGET